MRALPATLTLQGEFLQRRVRLERLPNRHPARRPEPIICAHTKSRPLSANPPPPRMRLASTGAVVILRVARALRAPSAMLYRRPPPSPRTQPPTFLEACYVLRDHIRSPPVTTLSQT